jgi:hypothetical protein
MRPARDMTNETGLRDDDLVIADDLLAAHFDFEERGADESKEILFAKDVVAAMAWIQIDELRHPGAWLLAVREGPLTRSAMAAETILCERLVELHEPLLNYLLTRRCTAIL